VLVGFALIDYGFNFIAVGLPGARQTASQFVGLNMLLGGSAVVFISLLLLLRPTQTSIPGSQPQSGALPETRIETVAEEQAQPQFRSYEKIEYLGYFITSLGLLAAADLVLQVFVSQLYNEARWSVEVLLLVLSAVLAYAIFGSLSRPGAEEKRALVTTQPGLAPSMTSVQVEAKAEVPEVIELNLKQFSRSSSGEYERKLTDFIYDVVSVRPEMINVWRENRTRMRTEYLAGPYELSSELLEAHAKDGAPIRIGTLSVSIESIQELLSMQRELKAEVRS
jgi:hypothetical protein